MDSLKKLFECNICNGEILNPNQIQCGHILCNCCIKKWLEKKKASAQCPECQVKINRRALKSREDITDLMSKFMKLKELFEKEAYESQIISNSESQEEKVEVDSRENNKYKRPRPNSRKDTTTISTTFPKLILQNASKRLSKSNPAAAAAESPESKRQKVEESQPIFSPVPHIRTYSSRNNAKSTRRDRDSNLKIVNILQKLDENEEEIDLVEESVFDDEELAIGKDSQISKPPQLELDIDDRNVDDNMEIEYEPLKGSEDLSESKSKPTTNRAKYAPSQKDMFAMTEMNEDSDDDEKLRDVDKEVINEEHLFLDKTIAEAETQVSYVGLGLDNESTIVDENNSKDSSNKLKLKVKQDGNLENIEIDVEKSNSSQVSSDAGLDNESTIVDENNSNDSSNKLKAKQDGNLENIEIHVEKNNANASQVEDVQLKEPIIIINPDPVEVEVEVEVEGPLDLSMPKKFVSKYALPKIKYALRFVKPLDLSSSSKLICTPKGSSSTTSIKNGKKASPSETESSENFYTPNYLAYLAEAEQENGLKTPSLSRLRNTSLFREISGANCPSQKSQESQEEDIVGKYYKYKDDESLKSLKVSQEMSQKVSQEREQQVFFKDSQDQNSSSQKINHLPSSISSNTNSTGKDMVDESPVSKTSKTPSLSQEKIETVIEPSDSDNEEIADVNKSNVSSKSKSLNLNTSKNYRKFDTLDDSDDRLMGALSESIFAAVAVKDKSPPRPPVVEKKNFVFCTTRLSSSNQMNQLKELCDIYGGRISTNFTSEVTHLVVNLENDRISQTLKYFHAIASGKWVIIFDWVQDSLRAKKLLAEDQFEVDVANFPFCDAGPRRSRLSSKRKLFDKVNFYFGDKPTLMPLEDCIQILEELGATVLETYSKDFRESIIFIGDKENRKMNYMELFRSKCWITVTQEWILDCISSFNIVGLNSDYLVGNIGYHGLIHAVLPKTLQRLKETFVQTGPTQTQYTCS